jgi:enoyl-CoA hydratase
MTTNPSGDVNTYDNVLVDLDGPVATITLNRPERLNALSAGLMEDLDTALGDLNRGDAVRVIRIKGAGRAFCPGYDLNPDTTVYERGTGTAAPSDALAGQGESDIARDREGLRMVAERWLRMWNFRKPIIAQVHNYCLSGALDLIGACDIVFAADGTRFGHPAARGNGIFVTLGMLPLKIGAAPTKELLFTGDMIDAKQAQAWGIISHVVPADELDERTMAFCQRVAMLPLDALTVHKHITNRWLEIMGLRLAALEGAEYDAIFHMTPANKEFGRRAREDGLRAALDWRDGPFATGPAADHDANVRRGR